jgi:hypothetical protein
LEKIALERNIFLYKDILNEEESEYLLNVVRSVPESNWTHYGENNVDPEHPPALDTWRNNVLNLKESTDIDDKYLDYLMEKILSVLENDEKMKKYIQKYQIDRYLNILRFKTGDSMKVHCDGGEGSDIKYGTVLYLNDDFSGGQTYYPKFGIEVKPERGSLLVHSASPIYLHGVKEVTSGTRYVLAGFIRDIK